MTDLDSTETQTSDAAPAVVTPQYQVETLAQLTRRHLEHVLEVYGWHMTRAADALAVDRRTLYRMVERHGLKRPEALPPETRRECIGCGKLAPESDGPAEPGFVWACSPKCSQPRVADEGAPS